MSEVNKVILGNETLIDLTSDTVTAENLLEGATAHDASGSVITGKIILSDVINNLESDSETDALSAKQGKILNENKSDIGHIHVIADVTGLKDALDSKLDSSLKGASNGLAELDENGKVLSSQLPSYVDDVLEFENKDSFPKIGESGKIYIDITTNLSYRWTGSTYIEISPSLALGETLSTAYRGDRGKIAYNHSQTPHAPSNAEANVQSDWSETNTESDSYIKNKPTNLLYNSDSNLAVVNTTGEDTKNDVTTFTSEDSTTAESWTDVEVLSSGEKHSSLWKKVSTMFKNIRYLKNFLGTADISSIDDGTVTGAIKYINEKVFKSVSDGKILIADAITDKGVPTSADDTFAIMANNIAQISSSSGNIVSGEFTTASTSQGIVNIDCGFRPDILLVFLPISSNTSGYTTAYYAKTLSTKYSIWCLHPTENMTYTILLGSTSNGESGIQNITDTGFAFRCNASNTQNRKCTYIAYKSV